MKVEQIYTGCLAEATYYIESAGEVAIIDPLREVDPYLERAEKDGAKIKYILETHFHADFVSGHLDLAEKSDAQIVYGPTAEPEYQAYIAQDGEELKLGNLVIKVLHTPGHTMESCTFLLKDEKGKEHSIFTGDTLFIGDVGRPDLAVKTDLSREDLAGYLYDSLRNKIMPLSDDVIIYPGHGAGSSCGKHMSEQTYDTLGNQKLFNYALRQNMSKEEFINEVTAGLVEPPQYFPKNVVLNKTGYQSLDEVLDRAVTPMDVDTFEEIVNSERAVIIDTRKLEDFKKGYIRNSIFIGLDGSFASWTGTLIPDLDQAIVLITEPGREEEAVIRLARVGYDNTVGYLEGGFEAWIAAGRSAETIDSIEPIDFVEKFKKEHTFKTLDVRRKNEYDSQHIEGVYNFPLDFIHRNIRRLDANTQYYLHCKGGYRSLVATSILKSLGFNNIIDIHGGFDGLIKTGLPTTEYHEPISLL